MLTHGKIIILAGVDGVGKTTLLDNLCRLRPQTLRRKVLTDPTAATSQTHEQLALEHARQWPDIAVEDTVIYDRFPWPDNWVYQRVFDGKTPSYMWSQEQLLIEKLCVLAGVLIIYVEPAVWGEYWARVRANPDPYITPEAIQESIVPRYELFLRNTKIPHITVRNDFRADNLAEATWPLIDAWFNLTKELTSHG